MGILRVSNGTSWEDLTQDSVDHGTLTGLADNDHPQYSLVAHDHNTTYATVAQGALADTALQDAPSDGSQYARQDGAWEVVVGGSGGGSTAPMWLLEVSGTPNSATYTVTNPSGESTNYADTGTTSGLKAAIEAILAVDQGNPKHIHFGQGRFHFLDAPLGNEAWAGVEDHVSWGSSGYVLTGLMITGEGIDNTIISNRTNFTSGTDTEPLSFTNATEVTIRDLTVESCGFYRSTTDAIDGDQVSRAQISRVLVRRSRSRAIVIDGGDEGKNSHSNIIRDCIIQGRPPITGLYPLSGGSLTADETYDYALTWTDMDMTAAGVSGETRPSDPAYLTTTSTNRTIRLMIPRAPYSVTQTNVYRRSTTDGGWVLVGNVAGNEPTTFTDDGTAGTSAAVFTRGSTIPQGALEYLGCQDSVIAGNVIDGIGDYDIGAVQYGINIVRKSGVPTQSDRNIIADNIVRGTANAGIRVLGGDFNSISGNQISNPGTAAVRMNGIRLEGATGVRTDRNRVFNNLVVDDRDTNHPDGGGIGLNTAVTITSTNAPEANLVHSNEFYNYASSNPISDSGSNTVLYGNQGENGELEVLVASAGSALTLWAGTQAEYDLLTPDANTVYVVTA